MTASIIVYILTNSLANKQHLSTDNPWYISGSNLTWFAKSYYISGGNTLCFRDNPV